MIVIFKDFNLFSFILIVISQNFFINNLYDFSLSEYWTQLLLPYNLLKLILNIVN